MQMHMPNEAVFTRLDLKSVGDDGVFEGYASLFEREDLGRDVIARGAFEETLATRGARGVRLLFQHNPAEPIGAWETLSEDSLGLFARGRLSPDVARAREVLALMRAGALDGLSIGFRAIRAQRDRVRGVRRILKADLWEISIVTFPMLPGARIRSVMGRPAADGVPTERELERRLTQDAGLTRSQARALMRRGVEGLGCMRDAAADADETRLAARLSDVARLLRSSPSTPRLR